MCPKTSQKYLKNTLKHIQNTSKIPQKTSQVWVPLHVCVLCWRPCVIIPTSHHGQNPQCKLYYEDEGTTWGHWCASADNYGANRKWVLLKIIPTVDVEGGADEPVPAAFNTPGAGPSWRTRHTATLWSRVVNGTCVGTSDGRLDGTCDGWRYVG